MLGFRSQTIAFARLCQVPRGHVRLEGWREQSCTESRSIAVSRSRSLCALSLSCLCFSVYLGRALSLSLSLSLCLCVSLPLSLPVLVSDKIRRHLCPSAPFCPPVPGSLTRRFSLCLSLSLSLPVSLFLLPRGYVIDILCCEL